METYRDRVQLLESSSDESFELIDPNFDDSYYNELRGVAVADYIPMEEGEILLRKGLSVSQLLLGSFTDKRMYVCVQRPSCGHSWVTRHACLVVCRWKVFCLQQQSQVEFQ